MHETFARARFALQNVKKRRELGQRWICAQAISAPTRRRFDGVSFAAGIASACDKTHWHGCAQESNATAAAAILLFGIAAGRFETHCQGSGKGTS